MFRFNAIVESVTEAHLHLEVVTSGVESENKRVLKLNPTGIFPTRYLLVPCGSLIQILIPTGIDIQYSWGEKKDLNYWNGRYWLGNLLVSIHTKYCSFADAWASGAYILFKQ